MGERIIHESCADGPACAPRIVPARRKGCAGVTRSFSSRITEREVMEQAVAAHATRLGEKKLRRDGLAVSAVTVFYHTSEHDARRADALGLDGDASAGSMTNDTDT